MPTQAEKQSEVERFFADELAFYRELFFLTDKQRDLLESGDESAIGDVFQEIARVQARIEESETHLREAEQQSPAQFTQWLNTPQIANTVENIAELVSRTKDVVNDCARIAGYKRALYQRELGQIGAGRLLINGMAPEREDPLFFDQRP